MEDLELISVTFNRVVYRHAIVKIKWLKFGKRRALFLLVRPVALTKNFALAFRPFSGISSWSTTPLRLSGSKRDCRTLEVRLPHPWSATFSV